ncbi:acyl dehydratase [Halioglobus maricola]|uniref:Acyl dehydratase n=1 Tax=Halioglobus maricola TaxID=2601894 RepID=A0A5P9NIU8_9GAMM|nr:MaoC family dehydratase [Halioglobus maricola]QFU75697.1 acyl dehydratase [Halioglobus maricola]
MSVSKVHDVAAGQPLPELSIPITPKLIVGGAIASRDYQNVHHDKDAAQALGSPDIFMNILTTNGLVGRYITDWAGSGASMQKLAIRLGAPNFPGDTMVLSGAVSAVDEDEGTATISFRGSNSLGDHVTGTATVKIVEQAD